MKLGLLLIAMLAASAPARAVTYAFIPDSYSISAPGPYGPPETISLRISAAAVARGSFQLSAGPHDGAASAADPISFSGDLGDFVRLQVGDDWATPDTVLGSFSVAFTFDAAGLVTSSSFSFSGAQGGVLLSGTGAAASGTYGFEWMSCTDSGRITCATTGSWVDPPDAPLPAAAAVPEPSSLAMLAAGALVLAAARPAQAVLASRRRRWRMNSV